MSSMKSLACRVLCLLTAGAATLASLPVQAESQQQYEQLADSVRAAMQRTVNDAAPAEIPIKDIAERELWLAEMSRRLSKRVTDPQARKELLTAVHYEATRAGLDPQLVLSLIQIESNFRKYALSKAGAHGYMQVMPFWVKLIGSESDNLFHLRTNLRYGCTILRHYIDIEKGDLFRALGRYNGSLGRATYPNRVNNVWQADWPWNPAQTVAYEKGSPAAAQVHATLQALQVVAQVTPQAPEPARQAAPQPPQPAVQASPQVPQPAVPPVVVVQTAPPAAPATPNSVAQTQTQTQTETAQAVLPVGGTAPVVAQATPQPQQTVTRRNIVIVR
jgi:hypothetical protein